MTEKDFNDCIEHTLVHIKNLLITKGKEYRRNNDPFHNFKKGSKMTGKLPEEVLDGFLLKHTISVNDMVEDITMGYLPDSETVEEKFNDILVYTLIKKAMILDRISKHRQQ